MNCPGTGTEGPDYTDRLTRLGEARWKRLLNVQAPFRWNLSRLRLGRTLDVGCGVGRNLAHLGDGAVGVDHNPTSVREARNRGLTAFTVEEFFASPHAEAGAFDSLLAAHLVEHLTEGDAREVIGGYLPFLRTGGRAVFITPQERGYASDATHLWFVDFDRATALAADLGLRPTACYSFPFPRIAGRWFTYNEFVTVSEKQ
jgi:SAM-dependent methyltransferase